VPNYSGYAAVVPPPQPVHVPPAPVSVSGPPPGPPAFTRSQSSSQKTAISQLQEFCQQNKLNDPGYRELSPQSGNGFRFTVSVNGRAFTGEVKTKKQDAKQSAAEAAMRTVGSFTSNYMCRIVCIIMCVLVGVRDRGLTTPASSTSYVKDLKEKYFDKNRIEFKKEYFVTQTVAGGYQCTLSIPGKSSFHGEPAVSKSDAEKNAARSALEHLKLL